VHCRESVPQEGCCGSACVVLDFAGLCCDFLSIASLSSWMFVFCALFTVLVVNRVFHASFSVPESHEMS
jgi:hypothetical protein